MKPITTLAEFDHALQWHDWQYSYSDDIETWRRGDERQKLFEEAAKLSPKHAKLYAARSARAFQPGFTTDMLNAVRIEVGVTTQAELDAIAKAAADEIARREAEALAKLVQYRDDLLTHDWDYGRFKHGSSGYRSGFEERRLLLERARYSRECNRLWDSYIRGRNGPELTEFFKVCFDLRIPIGDISA